MTGAASSGQIAIRLATAADQPALIEFLRDHWSPYHIFVAAPEVFDWQYGASASRLNMIFASNGNTVFGVLGFIPMGRFDPALGDTDILLAVWKTRKDAPPGLGLQLLKTLAARLNPRLIGAIGITEEVKPIYRALGYQLGDLHQSAIFNPARQTQRIAAGVPDAAFSDEHASETGWSLSPLDGEAVSALGPVLDHLARASLPAKSAAYVAARYLRHPWYEYRFGLISRDGIPEALCIWRQVEAEGASILRIVDIVGGTDWLAAGRALFQPLLMDCGADYIDLMQIGTPAEVLAEGGWLSPAEVPGLVLPNYFAPFERRTVTIACAWKLRAHSGLPMRLYRADSDQDRPNALPLPRRAGLAGL